MVDITIDSLFINSTLLFYIFYSRLQFDENTYFPPPVHKIFVSLLLPVSH